MVSLLSLEDGLVFGAWRFKLWLRLEDGNMLEFRSPRQIVRKRVLEMPKGSLR